MAGLLTIAVSAFLVAIHGELERAEVGTAHARLLNGVRELGQLVDQGAATNARQQLAAAQLPQVRAFVVRRGGSSLDTSQVVGVLNQLMGQSEGRFVALVTPAGEPILTTGSAPAELDNATRALAAGIDADDSVVTGRPRLVAERAYGATAAPVVVGRTVRGVLLRWTRIGAMPATEAAIRRIVDPRAEVLLAHPDAGIVIDAGGDPRPVSFALGDTTASFVVHRDGRELLAARTTVASPWHIVALLPRTALDGSSALFRRLVLAGFIIVAVGALVAWLASRRITQPLIRVTEAAEALARGVHEKPVALDRRDEIGRLGATFDEMARRIGEAHARLRAARAEAESANAAKSRFLGTMSHEIRTPLNAIVGYTEFLLVGIGGSISPQQRRYVERVQTSARHLLALVSDLLDLSSIEAGRLRVQCQPAPLRDAISDAIAVLDSQAQLREIELPSQCDTPLWYRGDPARLRQILINLLSNAVKFSEPGGQVEIVCGTTEEPDPDLTPVDEDRWTTVTVRDSGAGIPADKLDMIWDAFVQGDDSRTRTHGGSGLGLTISRRLARLMGGEITVESEPGQGAAFTVWLPSADPDAAANEVTAA